MSTTRGGCQWVHLSGSAHRTFSFRFPGSQPVSFATDDLDKLEQQEYVSFTPRPPNSSFHASFWVCEKSDGIRVLLFVFTDNNTKDQMSYLVRPGAFAYPDVG